MPATSVGWADARAAVASMARGISDLIRSVQDPDVHALGAWTAGELAAHLTHVFEIDLDLVNGVEPPLADLADLAEMTQVRVRDDAVRDPLALARRVEEAAAAFLAATADLDGGEPRLWLGGVKATTSFLACHIVSESMIHGLDLARAVGRRWPIDRGHAVLAFEGFIGPMYRSLGRPGYAVDPVRAAGVTACYDVRLRGGGRVFFAFAGGGLSIEAPSDRPVDCRLSIDPRALMLLAWHRTGLAGPILRGQVFPWGRRPWLALRLPGLIRTP